MTLRSYFALLVLAALLPSIGFSVFMMIDFGLRGDAEAQRSLTQTARALGVAADREVAGTISALRALAASEDLGAGVDLRRFDAKARRVVQNEPLWRAVLLLDATGQQLVNTSAPFGASLPSLADRPSFQQVVATGKPVVSNLVLGHVTKTLIVPILLPITQDGRVRYVLEAAYDAAALSRLLARQALPPGGVGALIDRSGTIIARTRDAERFVGGPAPPGLSVRAALSSDGAGHVITLDGAPASAAFSRSPLSGWVVALATPAAEVAALRPRPIWLVVGGGVWSILLGMLLATLLGRRGVKSIRSLAASTRALGRGEDFTNPASAISELNELGRAMEQAATQRREALTAVCIRVQQQAAVADLGRRALTGLDVSALLDEAVAAVARCLDSQYAYVLERLADPMVLSLRAGAGWEPGILGQTTVQLEGEVGQFLARLERGPLVIDQLEETSSGPVSFFRNCGAVSCLWTAIRGKGLPFGVLGVATTSRRRFTADEAVFLRAVANVLAAAITRSVAEEEQRKLLLEERKARAAAEGLSAISQLLSESLESKLVIQRVVENVCSLLGALSASVYLIEPGSLRLAGASFSHSGPGDFYWPATLPAEAGLAGVALREGRGTASPDVLCDPRVTLPAESISAIKRLPHQARLAVPLVAQGETFGVMVVADRTGRVFREDEIELATTFSFHAALALRNARVFGESQQRLRVTAHLGAVGRLVSQSLEPDVVGRRIADSVRALFRGKTAAVYSEDAITGNLIAMATAGFANGEVANLSFPPGTGMVGLAFRERRPVTSPDLRSDPRVICPAEVRAKLEAAGVGSGLCVPLIAQGRLIGVLSLGDRKGRVYAEDEVALARLFADQAAVALENARLYKETQTRLAQTETLLAVDQAASGTLDLTETMRRVAREIDRVLGADMVGAYLSSPDGSTLRPLAGYHVPASLRQKFIECPFPVKGHRFVEEARELGQPTWSSDAAADHRIDPDAVARFPLRSVLFAPMLVDKQLIGGIFAVWWREERRFSVDELRLAGAIAQQTTVNVENARLYEQLERHVEEVEDISEALRQSHGELQLLSHRLVEVHESENRELARELHDQIGQMLTALKMTLKLMLRTAPAEMSERLKEADGLTNELLQRIRALSLDLRPPLLDDLGLLPALLWQFEQYTARTNVRVAFKHQGLERRFRPELETAAYRIVQEALTNVARHAQVDEVEVRAWVGVEKVNIEVEDRGVGFDVGARLAGHRSTGLSGMKERAALLGVRLSVESSPGAGTRLSAALPLTGHGT